jgi:hypothetical protein
MWQWRRRVVVVVVLSIVTLVSAKSKVVMSWKNPAFVHNGKFKRVLALGMSDKTGIRADFEDALAAKLTEEGLEAVPAHTILLRPEGTQVDINYIRAQILEHKIDAVLVSRLIKVDHTVTYIPGGYHAPFPYYNNFYGYYGALYPMIYTPDYLKEEKKVRIETNLYAVGSGQGELVWTGFTDTFNPSNVDKEIGRLVKVVLKQMRSDGAI